MNENQNSRETVCPHCGVKTIEYTNPLNAQIANFVRALYAAGGEKVKAIDLGFADKRTNFHKMAYWNLAEQNERGVWSITQKGIAFVEGLVKVPKYAVVARNVVVRFEGPDIAIDEANKRQRREVKEFKSYPDFAAEAKEQLP